SNIVRNRQRNVKRKMRKMGRRGRKMHNRQGGGSGDGGHSSDRRRAGRIRGCTPDSPGGASRAAFRDAAAGLDAGPPHGMLWRTGMQQLAEVRTAGDRSLAAEARTAPARLRINGG